MEYTDKYVDQLKAEITSLKSDLFAKDRYYITILNEYEIRLKDDDSIIEYQKKRIKELSNKVNGIKTDEETVKTD